MRSYILWMEKRVSRLFLLAACFLSHFFLIWSRLWYFIIASLFCITCLWRNAARSLNYQIPFLVMWKALLDKMTCLKMVHLWLPLWASLTVSGIFLIKFFAIIFLWLAYSLFSALMTDTVLWRILENTAILFNDLREQHHSVHTR